MSPVPINHPLPLNTRVRAMAAGCKCRGGKMELTEGLILKVIPSPNGTWYYLDTGKTINQSQVQAAY